MTNKSEDGGCFQCNRTSFYNCLKICLLLYNVFFLLLGLSLTGLGIYAEVMRQELTDGDHVFFTPSVFLFSLGIIAIVFAGIGFLGALRDNTCLLRFFNFTVGICIVLEIGCGIAALVFKDPAKNFVNKYVAKGMETYYDDQDLKNVVDYIQKEFYCCGGRVYSDWEINPYHNCSAPGPSACGVPYSCCVVDSDEDYVINSMCGYDTLHLPKLEAVEIIYLFGCIDAVLDYVWGHLNVLAGILLGIFLPQVVGIFLGILYLDTIRQFIAEHEKNADQYEMKEMNPYSA